MSGIGKRLIGGLAVLGLLSAILATSAMAQSWTYRYDSGTDTGFWSWGSTDRFKYDYTGLQWWDFSGFGGWLELGDIGFSPADRSRGGNDPNFLGNGFWHAVADSLSYMYVQSGDSSRWKVNGNYRFAYSYARGQWGDYYAGTNTWSALGSSGLSSAFLGDGAWHTVGTGLFYEYLQGGDSSRWKVNGDWRFAYSYTSGQWADYYVVTDTWSALGSAGLSSAFVGDGSTHDLFDGFSFRYDRGTAAGYWLVGGTDRFYYDFGDGQWSHRGDDTDWTALTADGYSNAFIGNGDWHDFGKEWSYQYVSGADEKHFKDFDWERFSYSYGPSQWYHKGFGADWGTLSATGVSAEFIGDGKWHDLGFATPWSYYYGWSGTDFSLGIFKADAGLRFEYDYGQSQWLHKGSARYFGALSATGVSAEFVGDGAEHSLGNRFTYYYSSADDCGYFKVGAAERFYYSYGPSQWYHKGDTTDWAALTTGGYSAAFIGDGKTYDLGDGVGYYYTLSGDNGWFKIGGKEQFWYAYTNSQWRHKGANTDWGDLSAAGISAAFVGDGEWHNVGYGFTFKYNKQNENDAGGYKRGAYERFFYAYETGQWFHVGNDTNWVQLTGDNFSAQFIGDGETYDLGAGFTYYYSSANDYGYFKVGDAERFYYGYSPAQWFHKGDTTDWAELSVANYSAEFVGDGQWHDLGFGNGWAYQYVGASEDGYFKKDGFKRFDYNYEFAQWSHRGDSTDWGDLIGPGASAAFVGDGQAHDLDNGFTYYYSDANDYGYFKEGASGPKRFRYSYTDSQWFHRGNHDEDWSALTGTNFDPGFVGDGDWHVLNTYFSYSFNLQEGSIGYFCDDVDNVHENRFKFKYVDEIWYHRSSNSDFIQLTPLPVISAQFFGDGGWHYDDNGWFYRYDPAGHIGYWGLSSDGNNGDQRFNYSYIFRMWRHKGHIGSYNDLGTSGWWDPTFLGDGAEHWVNGGSRFAYQYAFDMDRGFWGGKNCTYGVYDTFIYYYDTGRWRERDAEQQVWHDDGPGHTTGLYNPQ